MMQNATARVLAKTNQTGRNPRIPFRMEPMLATLEAAPFNRPGWIFEEKYDGVRMLVYKEGSRVR